MIDKFFNEIDRFVITVTMRVEFCKFQARKSCFMGNAPEGGQDINTAQAFFLVRAHAGCFTRVESVKINR